MRPGPPLTQNENREIKVRFLAASSLISLAESSRRGGDLVRVVAEEAVAQVPALDLLRDGFRLIDLVICQGGTRLTEQGVGVLTIMGQRLSRLARAVGSRSGRLSRGGRSSRAGCQRAGRIALARRFRLGLAVEGRSGRLSRGRRTSRAGCQRRAHRPGQAVQAWAGCRGAGAAG